MRYKDHPTAPATVKDLPSAAARRIMDGETWLSVWCQQLTVPLATLAKKSAPPIDRLSVIQREQDMPTAGELDASAKGRRTIVKLIAATVERPE